MAKTVSCALNLLIDIGYFPVHVNLDMLKLDIRADHPDEIMSAAEELLSESVDPDTVGLLLVLKQLLNFILALACKPSPRLVQETI